MTTIIFLCNGEGKYGTIKNRELPELIKSEISSGNSYIIFWSCGNSKFIEVGDRAYLQRSGNITAHQPSGFIASGYVISAPKDQQLKLLDRKKYSNLSEAYGYDDDGCFFVYIQIDSVVDFDFPLEQKDLRKKPEFQGVNFNFGGSGCRFDSKASSSLDSAWEEHSLIQQRKKRGRRLVDFFFEQGQDFKEKKEYQNAIDSYNLALQIHPKHQKSRLAIDVCLKKLDEKIIIDEVSLVRKELDDARDELDKENFFTFESDIEDHKKIIVSIARRQGQSKFRQLLIEAYSCKCAITNFDAEAALEAAHIIPYIETADNHPSNGLLLRADLHTLFDLNLIVINPKTMKVHISPVLKNTEYRIFEGKELQSPKNETYRPNPQFLEKKFEQCKWCKIN